MTTGPLIRYFVVVRGLVYSAGFVALWAWIAVLVRPLDAQIPFAVPTWLRPVGWLLGAAGALLAGVCVATFVTRGRGTPAPFDPPREFVATGPYRYVRNPMYVGGAATILGAGLILSSPAIALLALVFSLLMHLLVVVYEEPVLLAKFGESYSKYKSHVARWWVRVP